MKTQQQPEAHSWSLSPFQTVFKSGARSALMEALTAGSAPSLMSDNASGGAADSLLFIILEVCRLFLHAQEGFELCIFPCVMEAGVGFGILIELLIMVITMKMKIF